MNAPASINTKKAALPKKIPRTLHIHKREPTQPLVCVFQGFAELDTMRSKLGRERVRAGDVNEFASTGDALLDISCAVWHWGYANGF